MRVGLSPALVSIPRPDFTHWGLLAIMGPLVMQHHRTPVRAGWKRWKAHPSSFQGCLCAWARLPSSFPQVHGKEPMASWAISSWPAWTLRLLLFLSTVSTSTLSAFSQLFPLQIQENKCPYFPPKSFLVQEFRSNGYRRQKWQIKESCDLLKGLISFSWS